MCLNFCFYVFDDVIGVEIGGVVKNVIVIVCGIVVGLGFGENVCVVFIVRGFVEMIWFGVVCGGWVDMMVGFLGLGDFVFICLLM